MSPKQLHHDMVKLRRAQKKVQRIKARLKAIAQAEHEKNCPFCRMKKAGGALLDLSQVMQKLSEHAEGRDLAETAPGPATPFH